MHSRRLTLIYCEISLQCVSKLKKKGNSSMTKNTVFKPTAANAAFSKIIVTQLDGLVEKRKAWEATDYRKANEGLYALLASCLDVFNSKFVNASDDDRKTLRGDLSSRLTAAGVKVQRNTTTLTMFVRFVFGSDRKRAHGYAYVLKAAISYNKSASELSDWIVSQGGIEEIKRAMVVSEKALARQAEIATAKSQVTANIEQAAITPLAQISMSNVTGKYALLLGKPSPDGVISVVAVLSDIEEALYNALLMKMAKKQADSNATTQALNTEASDLIGQSKPAVAANQKEYQLAA